MLRDHSQQNGQKLTRVAAAVVDSHLLIPPQPAATTPPTPFPSSGWRSSNRRRDRSPPGAGVAWRRTDSRLGIEFDGEQLNDEPEFALTECGFELAHNALRSSDCDPITYLERDVVAEMSRCDDFPAPAELVTIYGSWHPDAR
jgi:hypothetical protein